MQLTLSVYIYLTTLHCAQYTVQRFQLLNAMVVLILALTVPKTVKPWLLNLLTERLITPLSKQQRQKVVLLPEKLML